MFKKVSDLNLGFSDAENYKRREHKTLFNKIFLKGAYLDKLLSTDVSFLIGEKGTGKTAYAVYLANTEYQNTSSMIKYIRETEYNKFLSLKRNKQLELSDFSDIWKVILLLLMSDQIISSEQGLLSFNKFKAIRDAIDDYYNNAFSPEISQALMFVEESDVAAQIVNKHIGEIGGKLKQREEINTSRFQLNLLFIKRKFEESLSQVKLKKDHILFIDGIDIRPSNVPYQEYLECIKGLANAVWEINSDFFANIKDSSGRMKVVLLVRPDIFQSLGLQNQNTKIRSNSVLLNWLTEYSNHRESGLFEIADQILKNSQDSNALSDYSVGKSWDYYFPWNTKNYDSPDKYRDKNTSFIYFLRNSYYRPRDIITMLIQLQESIINKESKVFEYKDIENSTFMRDYSSYLLGEIKDQLLFYYSQEEYELFLKFFEYLNGSTRFSYEEYISAFQKLDNYIETINVNKPRFMSSANEFLQFLYELNIICFKQRFVDEDRYHFHWCFRDRSYSNISPKVMTNVEYEIFYGLAKSLNLGQKFQ